MSKLILLTLIMGCAIGAASAEISSCEAVLRSGSATDAATCYNKLVSDKSIWSYALRTDAGDAAESLLAKLRSQNLVEKFATGQINTRAWVRDQGQNVGGLDSEACGDFKPRSELYYDYLLKAIAASRGSLSIAGALKSGHGIAACIVMLEACKVLQQ